ncbi:unnamed protein product, partial [Anisakis simplex]|uniref:Integrase core domain containing protein n=1 Tax=Anisakis simplex TaxID=6269 RepID=A0A0M3JE16_ANISI
SFDVACFQRSQQQEGGGISGTSTPPTEPRGDSPLRNLAALSNGRERHTPPVNQQQQSAPSATATIVPRKRPASHGLEAALTGHSSTDALLAAIRATTNEATGEPSPDGGSPLEEGYDDDTEDGGIAETMAQIFAASKKRLRAELDASDNNVMHTDDSLMTATNDEAHDPADILGNVAAMFNAEDIDVNGLRRRSVNGVYS